MSQKVFKYERHREFYLGMDINSISYKPYINNYTNTQAISNPTKIKYSVQDELVLNKSANEQNSVSTEDIRADLEKTKSQQSFMGKFWDGFKNLTGLGAGSNKAKQAITDFENGKISQEEMQKKVNGYKEGQKMCIDVIGDIVSGILAVGAFAFAVPSGGASLTLGIGLAAAVGSGTKVAIKGGDALLTGKKYSGQNLLYDTITGCINGCLAPITNGIGASLTKTIGTKLGLTVVKEGTETVIEQGVKQSIGQGLKSMIVEQGVDVIGGTIGKRALALGAGMAVDGALGGAADNITRATLNGEDIVKAGIQGAIGGLIMAPVIGGGFKIAGKAGKAISKKMSKNSSNEIQEAVTSNSIKSADTAKKSLTPEASATSAIDEAGNGAKTPAAKAVTPETPIEQPALTPAINEAADGAAKAGEIIPEIGISQTPSNTPTVIDLSSGGSSTYKVTQGEYAFIVDEPSITNCEISAVAVRRLYDDANLMRDLQWHNGEAGEYINEKFGYIYDSLTEEQLSRLPFKNKGEYIAQCVKKIKEDMEQLRKICAGQRNPLEQDCTYYRGVSLHKSGIENQAQYAKLMTDCKVGDIIIPDWGGACVSPKLEVVAGNFMDGCLLKIKAPKGSRLFSGTAEEVRFPPMAEYKVLSNNLINGLRVVELEYITV